MTFTLDAQVAAVLAAAFERSGLPPAPPVGDVASRRVALDAMLGYFNNEAQPAGKVDISDHRVVAPDGAALLARLTTAGDRPRQAQLPHVRHPQRSNQGEKTTDRLGAVCLQGPLLISCPNSPRMGVRASEDHGVSRCSARRGASIAPSASAGEWYGTRPSRGPHRPGDASTPADPVTEKGALRVLGCDHKCLGESPPRSEACACVLPAKLHHEGPRL
jgi:hypothetical protein